MSDDTQDGLTAPESVRGGAISVFSRRKGQVCFNGHVMHPSWDLCPYCQEMKQTMTGGEGDAAPDMPSFELKCSTRSVSGTS